MGHKQKVAIIAETRFGVGHMRIVSNLVQALESEGADVTIITSEASHKKGMSFDYGHAHFAYIPSFTEDKVGRLTITPSGKTYETDPDFQEERKKAIIKALDDCKPDTVVVESWPFGRGRFDTELIPAIQHAHAMEKPAAVVSLARDVLFYNDGRTEENADQAVVDIINKDIDYVMVTGDSRFIPFDKSFSKTDEIKKPLVYSGYFTPAPPERDMSIPDGDREVIVTAGGGFNAHSKALYEAAIKGREHSSMAQRRWRLLVSDLADGNAFTALQEMALAHGGMHKDGQPNIIVERFRPDFQQLLSNAAASISEGGLNTTLEAMVTRSAYGMPVLIAPRVNPEQPNPMENEQYFRTKVLHASGRVRLLEAEDLEDPRKFASALDEAAVSNASSLDRINLNGAENTAIFIANPDKRAEILHDNNPSKTSWRQLLSAGKGASAVKSDYLS